MDSEVNHPRTLALFRVVLYLAVALFALGLVGVGLSVLGATVVLAGISLLATGDPNALGLALLAGTGLVTTLGLAFGLAIVARRLDRRVTASDRRPDPLDELSRAYVAGDIDEVTFERRVERVLTGDSSRDRRLVRRLLGATRARLRRRRQRGRQQRRRARLPPERPHSEDLTHDRDVERELTP